MGDEKRLDSWKAIAEYLGRDITTVMRWERTADLPVRRVPGAGGRRSVFAYATEIDHWLQNRSAATTETGAPNPAVAADGRAWFADRRRAVAGVLGLAGLVAVAFAVYGLRAEPPEVRSARRVPHGVAAFDARGRELWRRDVPELQREDVPALTMVEDVDGDGRRDVLLATVLQQPGLDATPLMLFDASGNVRWRRSLDDRYTIDGESYGPEWCPSIWGGLVVYSSAGKPRIAIAAHHHLWWPSVVRTFAGDGRPLGRFLNYGWLHNLAVTADGKYLLAAGVNNRLGGAILAVLDADRIDGTSPLDGEEPSCAGCPAGTPRAYFLVPWSDVARPAESPTISVHVAASGDIELHALQRSGRDPVIPDLIVGLSPTLEVTSRQASDSFLDVHRQLERAGQVTHSVADCPWRVPRVRAWTREQGWREIR